MRLKVASLTVPVGHSCYLYDCKQIIRKSILYEQTFGEKKKENWPFLNLETCDLQRETTRHSPL